MLDSFDVSKLVKLDIKTTTVLDLFKSPIIECFTAGDKKGGARIIKEYTHSNLELLKTKNDNPDLGLDMYFTPNGQLGLTNPIQRNKKSSIDYTWLVFDTDASDPDRAVNLLVEFISQISKNFSIDAVYPNLITKTYRGYHVYYRLEEPLKFDENNKDDVYIGVYKAIDNKYKDSFPDIIDKSTKDVSRLFRVPNSVYRKKETEKEVRTDVLFFNQLGSVNIEDLYEELKVFNIVEKVKEKKVSSAPVNVKKFKNETKRDLIDEKVKALKIKNVVKSLGYGIKGNSMLNKAGKVTDGWKIYEKENRVQDFSNMKNRPGGNCMQFITMHFKGNIRKVYEFVNDKLGIDCSSVLTYKPAGISVDFDDNTEIVHEESLGVIKVMPDDYCITYTPPKGIENIATNFYIEVVGKVEVGGKQKMLVQLLSKKYKSRALVLPTDSTIGAMNKYLRQEGMFDIRINSGKFINLLTLWLESKLDKAKEIKIINSIQYLEDGSFVAGQHIQTPDNKVISPDEKTLLVGDNIVNFNNYDDNTYMDSIHTAEDSHGFDLMEGSKSKYGASDFNKLIDKSLCSIYEPSVIVPLFLGIVNSIFSDFYYTNKIKLPHIIVWGETRAGKTEIITLCKKLLSFRDTGGIGTSSMTPFPFLIAGTTGVPVHLTEWVNTAKNSDFIQTQAKDSYDFRDLQRGTAKQTVNTYKMKSNIMFDGEEVPTQDALQTRSLISFFKKKYKKTISGNFISYIDRILKSNKGLINYIIKTSRSLFKDRESFLEKLGEAEQLLLQYALVNGHIKEDDDLDRILHNYSEIYCLYIHLSKSKKTQVVLDMVSKAMGETVKNNKQFDSSMIHVKNFFTPLVTSFSKGGRVARGCFSVSIPTKTIYINKVLLASMINSPNQQELFDVSCSFLIQNNLLDDIGGIIQVDLRNKKHKKYYNQWKGLLISAYMTSVLVPDEKYDVFQTVDKLMSELV